MKKKSIIIITIITLIFTFIFAEISSIYHFGSIPTLLTTSYLISIFSIFEYLLISLTYIIKKRMKKEKIERKKIIGLILLFIALLLLLLYVIVINVDYLHWYMYSSPFYLNVIFRSIEFLIPAIILLIIGTIVMRREK